MFDMDRELVEAIHPWIKVLVMTSGVLLLVFIVRRGIVKRFSEFAATESDLDDLGFALARRTSPLLLAIPVLHLSILLFGLKESASALLRTASAVALLIQTGLWATSFTDFWLARYRHTREQDDPSARTTISAFGFAINLFIWAFIALVALDNLGVNITALVTGLGIGGVAVALAMQNILGDLFASLSIVVDKPFVIGDPIQVGENAGVVEHIGLKTTRLRAVSGEQLILGNADILRSRIRNFQRMSERRVLTTISVAFDTPAETLEAIPTKLRTIVERETQARFDRAHFRKLGLSSCDFELVYFVIPPDYATYMDVQQRVNFGIVGLFAAEKIHMAYPTTAVVVTSSPAPPTV